MHVASCMVFDGPPPDARRARRARRGAPAPRPALPPAARVRPVRPGPPGVGRRSALQHALPRAAHRAARRRAATSSSSTSPAAPSRSSSTATSRCGSCGSSRGSSDGRFAILGKTHHALVDGISGVDITTVLFDVDAPSPRRRRSPEQPWVPRPLPSSAAAAGRRAAGARDRAGRDRARAALRRAPPAPRRQGAARRRRERSARSRCRAPAARRRARSTCRSARTAASRGPTRTSSASRRSRTRSAGPSTTSCSRPSPARLGRYLRAHGHPTIDLVLRAMVPVSVRSDDERGALGNQVAADVGEPAGRRDRPGRAARARARRDGGPEGVPSGRRRAAADAS